MRKNLIAALATLGLGAAAAAAFVGTSALAQAPAPRTPMLLAQAAMPNAATPGRRGPARGMARPAPTAAQQAARRTELCQDGYARAAGRFAYLEARLNLTGAQAPAFARWRDLRLAAAKQRAGECAARPLRRPGAARGANAAPPNPVERLSREETMLQRRLADIQAERPALDALYGSLNATQRQVLAREGRGFGRGGMGGRGGFGRGGMMRRGPGMPGGPGMMNGAMNRGMGGPGMRGPGMGGPRMMPPPGDNPPPPPPPQ
jgi:hypothetical protein